MWKIGNVTIKNELVLAPMAGISNPAYMKIVEEMGCSLAFTELISAEAIVRGNEKTLAMLNGIEDITIPVGIQLFGNNPTTLAKAAKIIEKKYHPSLIDLNMGCPVPKVVNNGSGSALLKEPAKIKEIVQTVVNAVTTPVTVKIRIGWDLNNINCVEIAKIIEEAGAKAISVHARTRSEFYSGKSHWEYIKLIKENVSIPVIGNGDIIDCYTAKKMLEETKCDAIMIGRASLGNPWIFKNTIEFLEKNKEPEKVANEEKITMIKYHFELLKKYKPEKVALLEMRSNALYYLKGMKESKEIKNKICQIKTAEEMFAILNNYLKQADES